MSVIRIKKAREKPYVILDTTALNDAGLSFRAKGLHTYLMAKPDDWQVHIEQLEKQSPREARDAIRGAMHELEIGGYVRRQRIRGGKGRMMGWDTTIYETPLLAKADTENDRMRGETIGLTSDDQPTTDYPTSDQPTSVQPSSANPQLLIIDSTQYRVLPSIEKSTPPTPSLVERVQDVPQTKQRRKKVPRQQTIHAPEAFKAFYAAYPRHIALQAAMDAWDNAQPTRELQVTILADVTVRARADPQWLKNHGEAIPYPATYLNNQRWSDEWQPIQQHRGLVE